MAMMGALSSLEERANSRHSGSIDFAARQSTSWPAWSRMTGCHGGLFHCEGSTGWPS